MLKLKKTATLDSPQFLSWDEDDEIGLEHNNNFEKPLLKTEEQTSSKLNDKAYYSDLKASLGNGSFLIGTNFNENEDSTCIEIALLLRKNKIKRWLIVPLLSILTLFYFSVRLYWSKRMKANWLYSRA